MTDIIQTPPVSSGPFCTRGWTVILTTDFAVVFSTFSGNTQYIDVPGKAFTLTANEDNCGIAEKTYLNYCWFKIQFVDRGSYDANPGSPSSWVYKSVPSVELKFTYSGSGTDLTIQAYRDLGQIAEESYDAGTFVVGVPLDPCTAVAPDTYSFSNFDDGIKEIVIGTDFADNSLLNLFLHSDYQIFTHAGGQCFPDPPPCIQCVNDGQNVGQADGGVGGELEFNVVFENKCWTERACDISIETTTATGTPGALVFRLKDPQNEGTYLTPTTGQFIVPARGTCTVNCIFNPGADSPGSADKIYQGRLVITGAVDAMCTFEATHHHPHALISADPQRADFPITDVNTYSGSIIITLTNDGNIDLGITIDSPPSGFEIITDPIPTVITPNGGTDVIEIVFNPLIDIQYDDILTIHSNAENVDPLTGLEIPLTGLGYEAPTSRLVLLFDTSGSMGWDYEGNMGVPPEVSRLNLARKAILPFLEQLRDFYSGDVYLGIGSFPEHPWVGSCNGHTIESTAEATEASIQGVIDRLNANPDTTTLIDTVAALGNTPLVAGLENAINLCGSDLQRAIVLLTDGYHNCPTPIDPYGLDMDGIIADLGTIKVYTIGFAKPEDFDSELLTELATRTTGRYHPVTVEGFNPNSWTPETALQTTFTKILVEGLGLQAATEPFGVIESGDVFKEDVNICEFDRKVSFFLGWESSQKERLILRVFSSDNTEVPTSGTGNRFSQGVGYSILTVDESFLQMKDKVGTRPWRIEIDTSNLDEGESEKYQYSVVVKSDLKLKTKIIAPEFTTGESIMIQAHVHADDKPVTGLKVVTVNVETPEMSLGNWHAGAETTEKDLKDIEKKRGDELLSDLHRKTIYMTKTLKMEYPGIKKAGSMRLYDDGSHGDEKANDGIYTISFSNTREEGHYTFDVKVIGTTPKGIRFKREARVRRHLRAVFSPKHSDIEIIPLSTVKDLQQIRVVFTPRDKYGNHLGPGYGSAIQLIPSNGQPVGTIIDDLSGSYSQITEIPSSVVSETILKVRIGKTETSVGIESFVDGLRSLFNRFRWLLLLIIAILIIYIVNLGMQP